MSAEGHAQAGVAVPAGLAPALDVQELEELEDLDVFLVGVEGDVAGIVPSWFFFDVEMSQLIFWELRVENVFALVVSVNSEMVFSGTAVAPLVGRTLDYLKIIIFHDVCSSRAFQTH